MLAAIVTCASLSLSAQAPAPSPAVAPPAPRWPDGRVNLGSSPDRKGYWEVRPGLGGFPRAADVPMQPWARALYQYRTSRTDLYPPLVRCKPAGGPGLFYRPGSERIAAPDARRFPLLTTSRRLSWRVIRTGGRYRRIGAARKPSFFGHSI